PLSAVAHFALSAIATSLNRTDDARVAGERAVELQPDYAFGHWGAAIGLARSGQREKAEAEARLYLTLSSSAAKVDDALIRDLVSAIAAGRDTTRSASRLLQTGAVRGHSIAAWMFTITGQRDSAFTRLRQ